MRMRGKGLIGSVVTYYIISTRIFKAAGKFHWKFHPFHIFPPDLNCTIVWIEKLDFDKREMHENAVEKREASISF